MNKLTNALINNTPLFNRFRRIYRSLEVDLSDIDLSGVDLSGVDLSGVDLSLVRGIFSFNKQGGRICYAVVHDKKLMIQAGCFWGTLSEFDVACEKEYGNDEIQNYYAQRQYLLNIERSL